MSRLLKLVSCGFVFLFVLAEQVMADPLSDAQHAYSMGDYAKAAQLYIPLAKQGHVKAQLSLGVMYSLGQGVEKDDQEATKWFELAAGQGQALAQDILGETYDQGRGVPKDYSKAVRWYRLAAEQGDALGQYNLGIMYARELGVPQDYVRGYMWMYLSGKNLDELAYVASQMTPDQIILAQDLAKKCTAKKFKGC
jgi:hypothetical protein